MTTEKFKQTLSLKTRLLPQALAASWLGASFLVVPIILPVPILAAVLADWGLEPHTNRLELLIEQATQPRLSVFNQPPRIVIDLPNTKLAVKPINEYYEGDVRRIQIEQFPAGGSRIVLEFQPNMVLDPARVQMQKLASQVDIGAFRDRWVVRPAFVEGTTAFPMPSPSNSVVISVPPPAVNTPSQGNFPSSTLPGLPVDMSGIPSRTVSPSVVVPPLAPRHNSKPGVLLPKGTVLNLRYSGNEIVTLERGVDRYEVLLLNEAVRDPTGNVIIPADTPFIGYFETNSKGSRFVVKAITLDGRNLPISARSERLRHLLVLDPGEVVSVRLTEAMR
ncbi:MAG: AMIN domain-containing protein [Oscillatoriaceae bacterium SKW80]|nr:AMIN domain-containing protein [Oscillatoriaceae bacterium SKYG93]MCX8121017.1 AMIN domain-containing protein [Oscillatoriaceae bacterium SKW80]MDW8452290.1 AMIN domain-containing protein [Oscillatoriaceae cyanobacterium SKYGB_i_bin93]HIK26624.1 AMIN domain-containing protein [Oscillatoriaceae cyanobacterium M7585_C2015_266]